MRQFVQTCQRHIAAIDAKVNGMQARQNSKGKYHADTDHLEYDITTLLRERHYVEQEMIMQQRILDSHDKQSRMNKEYLQADVANFKKDFPVLLLKAANLSKKSKNLWASSRIAQIKDKHRAGQLNTTELQANAMRDIEGLITQLESEG